MFQTHVAKATRQKGRLCGKAWLRRYRSFFFYFPFFTCVLFSTHIECAHDAECEKRYHHNITQQRKRKERKNWKETLQILTLTNENTKHVGSYRRNQIRIWCFISRRTNARLLKCKMGSDFRLLCATPFIREFRSFCGYHAPLIIVIAQHFFSGNHFLLGKLIFQFV